MNWKRGTIDVHKIPDGTFTSNEILQKRIELLRNNTAYREKIEQASKLAGYTDKALVVAQGKGEEAEKIRSLIRQNKKAEKLIKEKQENEKKHSGLILPPGY